MEIVAMPARRGVGFVALLVWIGMLGQMRAARDFYVSPNGSAGNRGTADSPWDLRTALSGAKGAIQPGDTVYLLDGTYRGHFSAAVSGTAGAPIVFKAFRTARPVLDGNITTVTTSVTKAGRQQEPVSVSLASAADIGAGSLIVLGGGSGHDQLLMVTAVQGTTVAGTRRCQLDPTCTELPAGSMVWVSSSILTIPAAVHDVWFQGLEITDTGTEGRTWATSSDDDFLNVTQRRQNGISSYGARTKIIDCVVHDAFNGIGAWTQAVDSEYSGVIAFNNGMMAPDRGHGHGFYIQNELNGMKAFRQIVSMQNFGYVGHMYVSRSDAPQGNVTFDETVWVATNPGTSPIVNQGLLLGGAAPLRNVTVRNSHFYGRPPQVGYGSPDNDGMTFVSNIFRTSLQLSLSKHVIVTGNIFAPPPAPDVMMIGLRYDGTGNVPADYTFSNNVYFRSNQGWPYHQFYVAPLTDKNCGYYWWSSSTEAYGYCPTPQSWQETLGYDRLNSTYFTTGPTGVTAVMLADPYDPRRYTVVIHNWDRAAVVSVNVSGLRWPVGRRYTLRNVADYYGDVLHGVYEGAAAIEVPMTGHTIAKPFGYPEALAASTFPDIGVFVLQVDD